MHYFYLHGWCSGPQSNKARFINEGFRRHGLTLHVPDLNQGDFFHLTLTRQIQQVQALLPAGPITMLGSSFGALTALWLAETCPRIQRLVLLAPAFRLLEQMRIQLDKAQFEQWRRTGELEFYHYAWMREAALSYTFITDLAQYDETTLQRRLPVLILHGTHDTTIPVETAKKFAATRPWIELKLLDSDHMLGNVQAQIWQEICSSHIFQTQRNYE
ncbi:MAG: alpha/beta fold hydrolase [Gammaproteobacteria bacterium]|nr:alpha/beta fold hydrolase [Gammaproteobacteria bacterium]